MPPPVMLVLHAQVGGPVSECIAIFDVACASAAASPGFLRESNEANATQGLVASRTVVTDVELVQLNLPLSGW